MKKNIAILLLLFSTSIILGQSTFQISSAKISFVFIDKDVDGTIGGFTSKGSIDFETIENSNFTGSVAVETLKTGNFLRDWSLKGGKYFAEKEHPNISFESTSVVRKSKSIHVEGNLTLKGTTEAIVFEFKENGRQLIGTTTINAYDYGIAVKKKREENKVAIKIELNLK